ncbi:MAG: ABC transporter permease [Alphaproteobacteria bacterium]|nr:ABC transporter permease [Alphaproteobacteria bacterium]
MKRAFSLFLPLIVAALFLGLWEGAVTAFAIKPFVLPAPSAIGLALWRDAGSLGLSALVTLRITVIAFALALVMGVGLAVLFAQSRLIARSLYPYAVALQVTPVVAIAPLILIWVGLEHAQRALLILATIVAFFPILSNTTLGLKSADPNLVALFDLYGAGRWQKLWRLQLPSALPFILAGAKVAGGLALIGTVVAEFVAGSGTSAGLAWRIIEAGNRLQVPKMFAALFVLSALGLAIFAVLSWIEWLALRGWHESTLDRREG